MNSETGGNPWCVSKRKVSKLDCKPCVGFVENGITPEDRFLLTVHIQRSDLLVCPGVVIGSEARNPMRRVRFLLKVMVGLLGPEK